MAYLNWRGANGILETIDELNPKDFSDWRAFRIEKFRLLGEYSMAGMGGAYWSSRPCKGWKD